MVSVIVWDRTSSIPGPEVSPRRSGVVVVDSFCVPLGHIWDKYWNSRQLDFTASLFSLTVKWKWRGYAHFFCLHLGLGTLLKWYAGKLDYKNWVRINYKRFSLNTEVRLRWLVPSSIADSVVCMANSCCCITVTKSTVTTQDLQLCCYCYILSLLSSSNPA